MSRSRRCAVGVQSCVRSFTEVVDVIYGILLFTEVTVRGDGRSYTRKP